jgi:RNA polymerase sigma-70 factor (ECF subfamily)
MSAKHAPATGDGNPAGEVKDPAAESYLPTEMQCETTRLMAAVKGGDREAFTALERAVRGTAFQVARSLVGSREDAIDLCQEAFLKVFRARESYDPAQPFLPWFQRILRNTCFSFLRKHGRLKKRSLSGRDEDGEDVDYELIDPAPGPGARIEGVERVGLFWEAFQLLSARDREVLALRHFRELSYKEMAEVLAIPEGTVMSRLFHARRRLREGLGPALGELVAEVRDGARMKSADSHAC